MAYASKENVDSSTSRRFPARLSDTEVRGIEFTVAVSSDEDSEPTGAPMLDALTTYREEQLN